MTFTKCVLGLRLESRKAQISDQNPALSVNRQLKLLQVSHSSFYYKSQREISRTASDERVKDEMMEIYMETPFYGVPRLTAELKRRGYKVNHKRVRRLQKSLNLRTVYPRPRLTPRNLIRNMRNSRIFCANAR